MAAWFEGVGYLLNWDIVLKQLVKVCRLILITLVNKSVVKD
jgi:hypothetical protein